MTTLTRRDREDDSVHSCFLSKPDRAILAGSSYEDRSDFNVNLRLISQPVQDYLLKFMEAGCFLIVESFWIAVQSDE